MPMFPSVNLAVNSTRGHARRTSYRFGFGTP